MSAENDALEGATRARRDRAGMVGTLGDRSFHRFGLHPIPDTITPDFFVDGTEIWQDDPTNVQYNGTWPKTPYFRCADATYGLPYRREVILVWDKAIANLNTMIIGLGGGLVQYLLEPAYVSSVYLRARLRFNFLKVNVQDPASPYYYKTLTWVLAGYGYGTFTPKGTLYSTLANYDNNSGAGYRLHGEAASGLQDGFNPIQANFEILKVGWYNPAGTNKVGPFYGIHLYWGSYNNGTGNVEINPPVEDGAGARIAYGYDGVLDTRDTAWAKCDRSYSFPLELLG